VQILMFVVPNDIYKRVGLQWLDGLFFKTPSRSHVTSLCGT
jgi:hypothetical protein